MKSFRRLLLWILNRDFVCKDREYFYVHDLDDRYKMMYRETFRHLDLETRQRMLK